jgi:peptidoglycan/LPS O-acetylase OafA/YrhL
MVGREPLRVGNHEIVATSVFRTRPSLLEDYVVGALFIAHVVGFQAVSRAFEAIASRMHRPIRWGARTTFTIYLLHLPVAQFLATQVP